jgi:membrane-anchored protein YejM (alkaline phosphatase superfamily)
VCMEYTKEIINAYKIISDVLKERNYNLGINGSTILKWSLYE